MKRTAFLALAATAILAAPALGQAADRGAVTDVMRAPENSVTFIISKKSEWKGSDELVAKLEVIAKKLDEDTKDAVTKIRGALPPEGTDPQKLSAEERQALVAKLQEVSPQREEFRKKDEAAIAEVLKVLNTQQQTAVKKLLADRGSASKGAKLMY
jgi:hypothetical protein